MVQLDDLEHFAILQSLIHKPTLQLKEAQENFLTQQVLGFTSQPSAVP